MQRSSGASQSTYSRLVLRDFLTYCAPGALLTASATLALSADAAAWLAVVERLPAPVFLPLLGLCVAVGLGLFQAASAARIVRADMGRSEHESVATAHVLAAVACAIVLSAKQYLPELAEVAVFSVAAVVVFGLLRCHSQGATVRAPVAEPAAPTPAAAPAKRQRSGGPRVLGAVKGPGVMLSRTTGAEVELVEPGEAWFKPGEVWTYNSRNEEPDSRVTVLKVQTHVEVGNLVHVAVDGLRIRSGPKGRCERISHLVLLEEALARSVQTRVASDVTIPEFADGYNSWLRAWEAGDSCVFFVPLQHAISTMEDAVKK